MKKENYKEYLRMKREAKNIVEYALNLAEHWKYYDSDALMDFVDEVVKYLGSEKEYEKFDAYVDGWR